MQTPLRVSLTLLVLVVIGCEKTGSDSLDVSIKRAKHLAETPTVVRTADDWHQMAFEIKDMEVVRRNDFAEVTFSATRRMTLAHRRRASAAADNELVSGGCALQDQFHLSFSRGNDGWQLHDFKLVPLTGTTAPAEAARLRGIFEQACVSNR